MGGLQNISTADQVMSVLVPEIVRTRNSFHVGVHILITTVLIVHFLVKFKDLDVSINFRVTFAQA